MLTLAESAKLTNMYSQSRKRDFKHFNTANQRTAELGDRCLRVVIAAHMELIDIL